MIDPANPGRSRAVAVWLFVVAAMVLAMVVVGGATRLTGSGLSITQWKPISGVLPPLTTEAWLKDFHAYQATPQYRLVNRGMTLGEFKFIYGWEWAHRLLGRTVGAAFALPFAVFLALRRMPRRLVWRCGLLLALGGAQGVVGWWMVKSGLEARVSVAPERLAIHLGLALLLFSALIWTALEAWRGRATRERRDGWTATSAVIAAMVFFQCLVGALVAGAKAGLVDNDWPLMAGAWFPADYWQGSAWISLTHGQAATQFNHRLMAYALGVAILGLALAASRSRRVPSTVRRLGFALAAVLCVQIVLGVSLLLTGVPLPLAILHQANAALLLLLATALAWRCRRT